MHDMNKMQTKMKTQPRRESHNIKPKMARVGVIIKESYIRGVTTSFPSLVTTTSLLPAATRELVADLVCPATKAINSIQSFRKHDLDFSPHTSHKDLGHGRCRGHHCGQLILQREWRLDPFCGLRLQSMCHQRSIILVLPIGTSR